MKRRFNLILAVILLFLSTDRIYAQASTLTGFNYKVSYVLTCKPNVHDTSYKLNINYDLYINDSLSYFAESNAIKYDSVFFAMNQSASSVQQLTPEMLTQVVSMPKAFFKSTVLKNKKTNTLIYTEPIERTIYGYQEPIPSLQWQLGEVVNEYMGIKVKQAIGLFAGRKYVAFYAEELPVSDGPYKFTGLPGLIVEIEDEAGEYKYSLSGFTKNSFKVASIPHTELKIMEKNRFLTLRTAYYTNPRPYLEQSANARNAGTNDDFIEMGVKNVLKWGRAMSNSIEK